MTNLIYKCPENPEMFVKPILSSRHLETGVVVHTFHLRYPRIIHGEVMTHRVFNRNARSSRAVPVNNLLAEIRTSPFVPWHWTGAKPGMQGVPDWKELVLVKGAAALHTEQNTPVTNEAAWLLGRDIMCDLAESFGNANYHKQVANRLVEPWMWMDLLVTATDWKNFMHLRDHSDAEPHIRDLAKLVGLALEHAPVQNLKPGQWHLPYITDDDWKGVFDKPYDDQLETLKRVSAARCARISYKPFDGNGSLEKELARFTQLVGNDAVHASPLEHQCTPDAMVITEVTHWSEDGHMMRDESYQSGLDSKLHGSLRGFIQFRKTVPNEVIYD